MAGNNVVRALICAVLVTTVRGFAPPRALASDADTFVAQGKDLVSIGQFKEAEKAFRRAIELEPENTDALYGAGFAASRQNHDQTAIGYFEEVLKRTYTDPGTKAFHTLALNQIGGILMARRRYDEAEKVFASGVKNDPENADIRYGYGAVLRAKGKNEKALIQFEEALKTNPKHAGALVGKASIYYEMGNVPEAFGFLQAAIQEAPSNPLPHAVMSAFYADLKKPYEQRLMLGNYYFYSSDPGKAANEYRAALAVKETGEAHEMLGAAFMQMGESREAETHFERSIKLKFEPKDVALAQLAMAQTRLNKVTDAKASIEKAIRINGAVAGYHAQLALLLIKTGDPAGAEKSCRKALALDPNDSIAYRYLGDINNAQGKGDDAVAMYEKSLSLDPNQPDVYVNLGWAYEQSGDMVSARRNYEVFLKMKPDPDIARKVRAQIEILKKREGK
jgi:tetratricopeptide (TPR) repeat protein